MIIELTEQQINNLIIFLDRVSIQGLTEVTAFNEIMNIFTKPQDKNTED